MGRTLMIAVLLTLPASPAFAVIMVEPTLAQKIAAPAVVERPADTGYGEVIAASFGLMVLGFAMSSRRKSPRVTA